MNEEVCRRQQSDKSDRSEGSEGSDRSDRPDRPDRPDGAGTWDPADPYGLRAASAEVAANTMICVIHQCTYLLRRQLETLEQEFLAGGGFTERLYSARSEARQQQADQSDRIRLIQKHGGYQALRSYHVALLVYDGTVIFCDRFIDRRSRTHDQMVQAARSGVQNIAEASAASGTSKKTELKLTGVARASLEELLQDYLAFLRQHGLRCWEKDAPEALAVRNKFRQR